MLKIRDVRWPLCSPWWRQALHVCRVRQGWHRSKTNVRCTRRWQEMLRAGLQQRRTRRWYVIHLTFYSHFHVVCLRAQVCKFWTVRVLTSSGNKCITHGGGKRCGFEGCSKIAQRGGRCSAHGGGRRCSEPGCRKHAQGRTLRCVKHGGGRRCH